MISQTNRVDSLKTLLQKQKLSDTSQINLYTQISNEYIKLNSRDAIVFGKLALTISEKNKFIKGIVKSYACLGTHYMYNNGFDSAIFFFNKGLNNCNSPQYLLLQAELLKKKGVVYYYKGNTDSALAYFKKSLTKYEVLNDSLEVVKSLNNIGSISLKTGQFADAINYFFRCLKYDEKNKDLKAIAIDYNNIGVALNDKKDYASANYYLKKSLAIKQKLKDTLGIINVYLNMGNVFIGQKKYPHALVWLNKALQIIDSKQNITELAQINNNLGVCYMHLKEHEKAIAFLQQSINQRKSINSDDGIAASLGNIGFVYFEQKDYKNAMKYYLESEKLAIISGEIDIQQTATKILVQCYLNLGQNNASLQAFSKFVTLNDSFYNLNSAKQIAEVQTKYETEKKETENKLLLQKDELNRSEIEIKNKTIIGLLVGVLLIIITIFWRVSVINLKKKNRELETAQALQKEKERISRDLHDNVGGQLSYVLYSLDGIANDDKNTRIELSKNINESVRGVISNLRETIWAINDESIAINDFSDKLKVYARNIFKNTQTKIIFNEQIEKNVELNSLVGLNLYRICQEIINNAFKHAKAAELKVDINVNEKITVMISDNGVGFDIKKQNGDGFGLSNIKSRAHEVGIKLDLKAKLNKGVVYTLVV